MALGVTSLRQCLLLAQRIRTRHPKPSCCTSGAKGERERVQHALDLKEAAHNPNLMHRVHHEAPVDQHNF